MEKAYVLTVKYDIRAIKYFRVVFYNYQSIISFSNFYMFHISAGLGTAIVVMILMFLSCGIGMGLLRKYKREIIKTTKFCNNHQVKNSLKDLNGNQAKE